MLAHKDVEQDQFPVPHPLHAEASRPRASSAPSPLGRQPLQRAPPVEDAALVAAEPPADALDEAAGAVEDDAREPASRGALDGDEHARELDLLEIGLAADALEPGRLLVA